LRAKFAVVALALAGVCSADQESVETIAQSADGRVGVSAVLLTGNRTRELLSFHSREHFPMQSVYKLPIAMTAMREVDRGKLPLDALVRVDKSEYLRPEQYSPLRDQNPAGATVATRELLRLAVSESDGTASDVVLRLIGGPSTVMTYLRDIGVHDVQVLDTERTLGEDDSVQYRNWTTPDAAIELLRALLESRALEKSSRDLLLQFMTESTRLSTRIKGLLPAGTKVAHKPGTSGASKGITAATNDIGIISLPDGRKILIAVFISDSKADAPTRDAIIARFARHAWDLARAN
jgi:beta-lactamase class A